MYQQSEQGMGCCDSITFCRYTIFKVYNFAVTNVLVSTYIWFKVLHPTAILVFNPSRATRHHSQRSFWMDDTR